MSPLMDDNHEIEDEDHLQNEDDEAKNLAKDAEGG